MHPLIKITGYIVDDMKSWQVAALLVFIGFCLLTILMWSLSDFVTGIVGAAFLIAFTAMLGGVGILLEKLWHRLVRRKQ